MEEDKIFCAQKGSGRPSKVSIRERIQIKRHSLRNRFDSSKKIKEKLNLHVTRRTVQNVLNDMEITARKPRKKPLLSKTYVKDRLAWAKKYESWTVPDWERVLFSDETLIQLIPNSGSQYVQRRTGGIEARMHHFHGKARGWKRKIVGLLQ